MRSLQSIYNLSTVPNIYGRDIYKPSTVYYIKIIRPEITVYKIGYTTMTVLERVTRMRLPKEASVEIVDSILLPMFKVYSFEQILHTRCQNTYDSYHSRRRLISSGNSELYLWDILGLDTGNNIKLPLVYKKPTIQHKLLCKCTRLQRAASPTAHVDTCPRYGIPV